MILRQLLTLIIGVFAATMFASLLPTAVSAVEAQYYWDGNEKIIVKHPYFSNTEECKDSRKANLPCNEGATFVLDRNSRDPFEFYAREMNDTIRANGVDMCKFGGYRIKVEFTSDGRTKTSGVEVPDGGEWAEVEGGQISNGGARKNACQKVFNQNDNGDENLGGNLHNKIREARGTLNEDFYVDGAHGRIAHLSALEDQLKRMYEREKKHFVHRVCSTHKEAGTNGFDENTSNCKVAEAEKAYKIIWDYCNYEARTLADETQRVAGIQSCIQGQSGVALNSSLVEDTTNNLVSYADGESCSIKFIGWIVCPLSRFMANVTDAAFDGLSKFLTIRPLNRGSQAGDALYSAWSLVNNVANVIFIIAFLAIIGSQVTGMGMSNYGVKRLLPRLILTAIFVNISYYVCVVAVDFSNILGKSLIDIIGSLEPDAVVKPSSWTQEVENVLVFTAGAAGIGMVLLTGSLVAMFPLLVGAALSFLVAILMVVARYALVIILIIIAPFAIALSLLPNTQKWYKQWQKMFISMLMLFPMISIVFGLSQVAGILVLNSSLARSTGDITLQLFGLAIMALPLALTPLLMKLSGGVLNRFGGVVSNRGFFKKTKERADNFAERKKDARDVKGLTNIGANKRKGLAGARDKMIQRRYRRSALQSLNKDEQSSSYANYISGYTSGKKGTGGDETSLAEKSKKGLYGLAGRDYDTKTKGENFADTLAKGGGSLAQVQADAINAQLSINTKEVKAAKMKLQNSPDIDISKLRDIATDNTQPEEIRQAAIEMVTTNGSMDDINQVVKSSKSMTKTQRRVLVKGVSSGRVAGRAAYYNSPTAQRAILAGKVDSDTSFTEHVVANWVNSGEVSADNVGSMHAGALTEVNVALGSGHVGDSAVKVVSDAAKVAKTSNSIQSKAHGTTESISELDTISRLR